MRGSASLLGLANQWLAHAQLALLRPLSPETQLGTFWPENWLGLKKGTQTAWSTASCRKCQMGHPQQSMAASHSSCPQMDTVSTIWTCTAVFRNRYAGEGVNTHQPSPCHCHCLILHTSVRCLLPPASSAAFKKYTNFF